MITLLQNGAWLLNGQEIVEDTADSTAILNSKLGYVPEKKDAATQTMAYNILQAHNTSDSKEHLKIKFDKMTSHDITFVGIIQTARTCFRCGRRSARRTGERCRADFVFVYSS